MVFKALVATRNYLNYGFTLLIVSPLLEMKLHENGAGADMALYPQEWAGSSMEPEGHQ